MGYRLDPKAAEDVLNGPRSPRPIKKQFPVTHYKCNLTHEHFFGFEPEARGSSGKDHYGKKRYEDLTQNANGKNGKGEGKRQGYEAAEARIQEYLWNFDPNRPIDTGGITYATEDGKPHGRGQGACAPRNEAVLGAVPGWDRSSDHPFPSRTGGFSNELRDGGIIKG